MNARFLALWPVLFLILSGARGGIIEETNFHKKLEIVQGHEFTYVSEESNGVIKEKWSADGQGVDRSTYLQMRRDAYQQEWLAREHHEETRRIQEAAFKKQTRCSITKKCVLQFVGEVERIIKQMKDYLLTSYFVFADRTMSEHEYDHLLTYLLPEARRYLELSCDEIDEKKFGELREQLEGYHEKIQEFFRLTLNNAIEHSDDTKLLKRLFELVA